MTRAEESAAQDDARKLTNEIAYIWQGKRGDDKFHLTQSLLFNFLKEHHAKTEVPPERQG